MKILSLGASAFLFVLSMGVSHAADVRAEIEKANSAFTAAAAKSDGAAVAALYVADGQVMPAASEPIKGTAAIQKFWQGAFDAGIVGVTLKTVDIFGTGTTISEVGQYELRDKTGKNVDHGKYIVIWKNEGGHWKLVRDMFSTNVAPAK